MPCCAWAASEYLQQPPSRAQRWRLLDCAPSIGLRSAGWRNWAQPAASDRVVAPGATGHSATQAPSRTIRAGILRSSGCGGLYEAWATCAAVHRWLAPHWKRSIAENARRSPSPHNWKSGLQELEPGRSPGTAQTTGEERKPAPWAIPVASTAAVETRKASGLARGLGDRDGSLEAAGGPGLPWPESSCRVSTQPLIEGALSGIVTSFVPVAGPRRKTASPRSLDPLARNRGSRCKIERPSRTVTVLPGRIGRSDAAIQI